MNADISADPAFKPAALDAIDVVYEVTAKFIVTAGAYNGIPNKETLVALINSGTGFAVALQEIIGGDLYAVTDPVDEKGRAARIPNLVHAGVYDGDDVIDIEGRSPSDHWSQRWRENGGCIMEGATGPVEAKDLEKFQSTTHTKAEIYSATKIAWLIAALVGALDEDQAAEYRKMQT